MLSNASPPEDLTQLVARISPRALMLIEAEHGAGGEELNQVYLQAAGEPKSLWRAKGGHTGALETQPAEYERRVVGFFERTLR